MIALRISLRSIAAIMRLAVNLNNDPGSETIKVSDIRSGSMLPAKAMT